MPTICATRLARNIEQLLVLVHILHTLRVGAERTCMLSTRYRVQFVGAFVLGWYGI